LILVQALPRFVQSDAVAPGVQRGLASKLVPVLPGGGQRRRRDIRGRVPVPDHGGHAVEQPIAVLIVQDFELILIID
jgi:hypothetical protein